MITVKGYAARAAKGALAPYDFARRDVGPHDVLIDVKFCGICHSDVHQVRDEWGGSIFPMVPGHEIAGVVAAAGVSVKKFKKGDQAGVGCLVDSCRTCPSCAEGLEQFCTGGMIFTYNGMEKDGKTPTYGGYSTKIVVDENYVLKIPKSIPLEKAAPLLCAGITLYSPLRHWKAKPGDRVGVMGLGGLGHMGVQLAAAMGCEVTVFSSSDKKRADAAKLGAKNYLAGLSAQDARELAGSLDLIVNTISAAVDVNPYLQLLKRDGTMIYVGAPARPPEIAMMPLIFGRRRLAGSLIGGIRQTQEMLDFCAEHGLSSWIETIGIDEINEAYDRIVSGDVRYRFVIDLASLN